MYCEFVVLGGGWSGILLSLRIKKMFKNSSVCVIEGSNDLGGLMRTKIIDGFVFDIGGSHIIFSKNNKVLSEILSVLGNNYVRHKRRTFIYLDGKFIPYPFENGIYALEPMERSEIGISFIEAYMYLHNNPGWKPKSFDEWITGVFGKEIARIYLKPYNEKIWKRPLSEIDADWVYTPGRLPIPDWRDIIKSVAGIPTEGYREQALFYYPLRGGIYSLYKQFLDLAIRNGVKVQTGIYVRKIYKRNDRWVINDKIYARRIYNTIPLREIIKALEPPEYIIKYAEKLDYNQVIVVGIALNKKAPNMHWIYVPDKNIIFHRYAWISNYSPYNAPKGKSALIAEITLPPNSKIDKEEILGRTIKGLEELDIINSEKEILFSKIWVHKYGYPIYLKNHSRYRREILNYLKQQNIVSIGRWGSWHYWNMDKIFDEINRLVLTD